MENVEITSQTFNADAILAGSSIPSSAEFITATEKFVKGDSAYKTWTQQEGNEGKTEQDFFDWIQSPATSIEEIVALAEEARVLAENIRLSNEEARVLAEGIRSSSETSREEAETDRETAEGLRVQAETARVNEWNNTLKPDVLAATEAANAIADSKVDKSAVKQVVGSSETDVISQKGVTTITNEIISDLSDTNIHLDEVDEVATSNYKTLNIGSSGLVTLSPTTRYFTYRVSVLENMILNIDLQRMINQTGSARCRLIIDMPILRTITITNPILWGGTIPTFSAAGQYVFEVIDVDGTGTPLVWQVASTTKAQTTGVILYVDSTGAVYSTEQINGEVATRTTSTWANPFKYLQNAINAAQAGDIVFVKAGTHKPTHLRTTPTVYVDGNCLDRNATFTMKNGVDVYGGFAGTESKTWQRVVDSQGFPTNQTILSGDIRNEAVIDSAILIGDRRTEASKANAAYNVVTATAITQLTYMNGVVVMYGNANGGDTDTTKGAGVSASASTVFFATKIINCTSTARGAGLYMGIAINVRASNNTSQTGAGFNGGIYAKCISFSNKNNVVYGDFYGAASRSCISVNNIGAGFLIGSHRNPIALCNNTGSYQGSAFYRGQAVNFTAINNVGGAAVYLHATATSHFINGVLFGNKSLGGLSIGFTNRDAADNLIFRNCAYDTSHPTISGTSGSDIDLGSCIQNLTAEQAKIDLPSFAGNATTPEQVAELEEYVSNISTKLRPKTGSILRGAGVKRLVDPITPTTDYDGVQRADTPTIGAFE